jgi:hypothetical protein
MEGHRRGNHKNLYFI